MPSLVGPTIYAPTRERLHLSKGAADCKKQAAPPQPLQLQEIVLASGLCKHIVQSRVPLPFLGIAGTRAVRILSVHAIWAI